MPHKSYGTHSSEYANSVLVLGGMIWY